MPRRQAVEPDDVDTALAPAVTAQQRVELAARGYRGPTPSTEPQAAALLRRLEAERLEAGRDGTLEGPRSVLLCRKVAARPRTRARTRRGPA